MFTSCLVGEFGEAADQLLVEVAHLEIAHLVGMQVDVGELAHHQVEQAGLVEASDLGGELEAIEDLTRLR